MRRLSSRSRRSTFRGTHRPATFLALARIPDPGIAALVAGFARLVGVRSGESREPHVTFFGPFRVPSRSKEEPILDRIREAGTGISAVTCRIGNPLRLCGRKGTAIALALEPDADLSDLYRRLVPALFPETSWCTWIDRPPGSRIFHLSLRISISRREAQRVWNGVLELQAADSVAAGTAPIPALRIAGCGSPITLFRIALVRRGSLWKEYDLARGIWLSRAEAFNPGLWTTTRREYRIATGQQLTGPAHRQAPGTFVISDLHLGHANIIRYCRRPFSSVIEMNAMLMDNWNYTVGQDDEVIFLGDLRYGREAPPAAHFLGQLHGKVTMIAGNHDEILPGTIPSLTITHDGISFLCIHDPGMAPENYPGWVIHGHIHNNDLDRYPFFNGAARTINVSAELVGYTPVGLDEIAALIRSAPPGEKASTLARAREQWPER